MVRAGMKQAHDYTKWHKFLEGIDATLRVGAISGILPDPDGMLAFSKSVFSVMKQQARNVPQIFVCDELFKYEQRSDIITQFKMIVEQIGKIPAPFDNFIVEGWSDEIGRIFLEYTMSKGGRGITANCYSLVDNEAYCFFLGLIITLDDENSPPRSYYSPSLTGFSPQQHMEGHTDIAMWALAQLIVALTTRGMETKSVPASVALNTKRERAGKPCVPDVSIIRIGHYYNQSGDRCEYDDRKPVRIHWRRGHMRGVWCGRGDERHLEQRYISPCLVNFKQGDDIDIVIPQVRVLH